MSEDIKTFYTFQDLHPDVQQQIRDTVTAQDTAYATLTLLLNMDRWDSAAHKRLEDAVYEIQTVAALFRGRRLDALWQLQRGKA